MKYLSILLFLSLSALAQNSKFKVTVEPIYGVEHTSVRYPEPARYITRTRLGLRAVAGYQILSTELEATQANSRRDYPSESLKVEDQAQRGMLGLRTTHAFGPWIGMFFRAGARITKEKTTITNTATSEVEVKEPPVYWDPYAGAGLQIAISNNIAISASATIIFTDKFPPESGEYDAQYTLGGSMRFGSP